MNLDWPSSSESSLIVILHFAANKHAKSKILKKFNPIWDSNHFKYSLLNLNTFHLKSETIQRLNEVTTIRLINKIIYLLVIDANDDHVNKDGIL
jgi:hypothetical protein